MEGEREYLSLHELLGGVREAVEDALPGRVWVKAELAAV